ncbi:MAG: CatB-related O-acetyltransferase [Planctomycetes bacterium]|nr:CatB-related O-acetyltransferase [Planctomycetota bacterium]
MPRFGRTITLGAGSDFAEPPTVVAYSTPSQIRVGRYSSIALGVRFILDADHHTDWVALTAPPMHRTDFPATKGDIVLGSDVWIGAYATLLSGVTVGDGAVVGAGAVVAKPVPPYAIIVGNPARLVRYRFDPDTIAKLLAIRWWDWPQERILAAGDLLWSNRMTEFLEKYADRSSDRP